MERKIRITPVMDVNLFLKIPGDEEVIFNVNLITKVEETENGTVNVFVAEPQSLFSSIMQERPYEVTDKLKDIENAINKARNLQKQVRSFIVNLKNNNSYFSNIDTETQPYLLLSDNNSEVSKDEYQEGYNKAVEDACEAFSKILIEVCPELLGYGIAAFEYEEKFKALIKDSENLNERGK